MQGFRFQAPLGFARCHPLRLGQLFDASASPQRNEIKFFVLARLALQTVPNASGEPSIKPVSEPIIDYWIDSGLGPGYSPLSGVIKKYK